MVKVAVSYPGWVPARVIVCASALFHCVRPLALLHALHDEGHPHFLSLSQKVLEKGTWCVSVTSSAWASPFPPPQCLAVSKVRLSSYLPTVSGTVSTAAVLDVVTGSHFKQEK